MVYQSPTPFSLTAKMAGSGVVNVLVAVLLAFLYQAEARGKFLDLSWTFDNTTQYFPLYRKAKLTWKSREITNAYAPAYKLWYVTYLHYLFFVYHMVNYMHLTPIQVSFFQNATKRYFVLICILY